MVSILCNATSREIVFFCENKDFVIAHICAFHFFQANIIHLRLFACGLRYYSINLQAIFTKKFRHSYLVARQQPHKFVKIPVSISKV